MKKIIGAGILLFVLVTAGAFGQGWAKSYNKDGQVNLEASVGYLWGLTLTVGGEWIIGEFRIDTVPIDFGVMVKGNLQIWDTYVGYSGVYWGAAPLFSLHMGLADFPLEWFISAGVGFYGYGSSVPGYPGFNFGFATFDGLIFHLSDMFGILVEYGYIGASHTWGAGLEIQF